MVGHPHAVHIRNRIGYMVSNRDEVMTVRDLIKILKSVDEELNVVAYDCPKGTKEVSHVAVFLNVNGEVVITLES